MAKNPPASKIDAQLAKLPTLPGVYIYRNEDGDVIYIGKAKNLRSRVRSYFQSSRNLDGKTATLVRHIRDIETILVESEVEALILEANLIKEHHPRYNIFLRDDKSYPYVRITNEPYPQVFVTRRIVQDGSRYLGPYTDVKQLRAIMKKVRKIFPIRSCRYMLNDEVIAAGKVKLCLDYHIHRCQGPCEGLVSEADYSAMIKQVEQFLKGKTRALKDEIRGRMSAASEKMDFEEAARLRDQLRMIEDYNFMPRQVVLKDDQDRDVLALAVENDDACAVVFKIRDGKVIGRQHFYLAQVKDSDEAGIILHFLKQYYLQVDFYPREILTRIDIGPESELLEQWLSDQAGQKVRITIPHAGERRKIVDLCQKNATYLLDELKLQKLGIAQRIPYAVSELQKELQLEKPPRRIEGFDISNIQGTDAVASMVCFIDGKPRKSEYRIFKIQTRSTPDDFAMMYEAVSRRYKRRLAEDAELPDLILIDGGKGQLSSAVKALAELNSENLAILGLAKRNEEIFLPGKSEAIVISRRSPGLKLLQQVRDEAHRFAISHYRKQHKKTLLESPLDSIEGIGPARKMHLLKTFGSLKAIKEASVQDLQDMGKLPRKVAEQTVKRLAESSL